MTWLRPTPKAARSTTFIHGLPRCRITFASYELQTSAPIHDLRSEATPQRCGATSENYTLQTRPVHPYVSYSPPLHVRVGFSRPTIDVELPPQSMP